MINGEPVIFEILDTCPKVLNNVQFIPILKITIPLCSKSNQDLLTADSLQWADGFLLVYSILDRSSFDYVRQFRRHLNEVRGSSSTPGIPCILLANKADMVHLRQVSPEEGKNSTSKINFKRK